MKAESKVWIYELPMVCNFPKVFPDDISDLSSECKVEFAIDVVPDTSLMSMTPYIMFTSRLSETKKQLEELLEKKFVRPSVSLWEASVLLVKKNDDSMRLCVNY